MENLVAALAVTAAAIYVIRRAASGAGKENRAPGGCSGSCSGCTGPSEPPLVQLRAPRRRGGARAGLLSVLVIAGLTASSPARAGDTVETWDVGASDVDFYMGLEGLNADGGSSFADIMLGYGILEGFSAYLGVTLASTEHLAEGSTHTYLGIFGTPLETDHVDLDVFLQAASGEGEFRVTPAVELNLDADPQMKTWGVYLRTFVPLYGRHIERPGQPPVVAADMTFHVASTLGAYRTIADRHQILLESSIDLHPEAEQDRADISAVSIGYNVMLTETLELISQVQVDVPDHGEPTAIAMMAGFIATLPSSGR